MMTALLLVPLIGAAGLAMDFGQALSIKSQLAAAADAAALGAIAEKSKAVAQAMAMSGDGTVALDDHEARSIFFGQMSGELLDLPVDVDIKLVKSNNVISSQVLYSATLPTTFMRILGKNDVTVADTATAEYQTPAFLDFYMLLDNTPSMGVGATPADVAKLREATVNGRDGKDKDCAFACHVVSEAGKEDISHNTTTSAISILQASLVSRVLGISIFGRSLVLPDVRERKEICACATTILTSDEHSSK